MRRENSGISRDFYAGMAPGPNIVSVEALIADSSWSRFQKTVLVLVSLGVLLDGLDNQLIGFAAPAIIADWKLAPSDMAPILGFSIVAMTLGTLVSGMMGDRIGRKRVLVASVVLFGIATCAMAVAQNLPVLIACRLVAAFGLGGAMPVATAMLAEFTPLRSRALAVTLGIVCVPLGGLLGGLLASMILPIAGWRALFTTGGILPLVLAALYLRMLPEAPSQLLKRKDGQAQTAHLLQRCGIVVAASTRFVVPPRGGASRGQLVALFSDGRLRDTLLLWLTFVGCLLAVYLVFNWGPTLLARNGADLRLASLGLAAFNLGGAAGATFIAFQIDRRGSRMPMLAMGLGATVCATATGWAMPDLTNGYVVAFVFTILGALASGLQTALFALAAHVYPPHIRSTGVAFALGLGRLGAAASSIAGSWAMARGNASYFLILASALLVSTLALAGIRAHSRRHAAV